MWNTGRMWDYVLIVSSKISFSNNSNPIETSQLICSASQMTGFYKLQIFTEKYLARDHIP